MEVLERIGLVERSGIGLDRIFEKSIKDGKGVPVIEETDGVILNITAKIKDINFVYYLEKISQEKQLALNHVKDFLVLEQIKENGMSEDKKRINSFLKNEIIEKVGKTSGQKYLLSKKYYEFIDKKSEYTRKKWLSKKQQKQVLLNYFLQYKKGKMNDFRELFENKLSKKQINILLSELRDESEVFFDGKPRSASAYWRLEIKKE
jgi:ATP-dependent DNA helicase RecG